MSETIYVARDGKQFGPYSEEEVRSNLKTGDVSLDDLAWSEGATDWVPLSKLLGVSAPPPLPTISTPSDAALNTTDASKTPQVRENQSQLKKPSILNSKLSWKTNPKQIIFAAVFGMIALLVFCYFAYPAIQALNGYNATMESITADNKHMSASMEKSIAQSQAKLDEVEMRIKEEEKNKTRSRSSPSSLHKVEYRISGTVEKVTVSFYNEQESLAQQSNVDVPWTLSFQAKTGQAAILSATNVGQSGSVICTIYIDGIAIKSTTSSGAYVTAVAETNVP